MDSSRCENALPSVGTFDGIALQSPVGSATFHVSPARLMEGLTLAGHDAVHVLFIGLQATDAARVVYADTSGLYAWVAFCRAWTRPRSLYASREHGTTLTRLVVTHLESLGSERAQPLDAPITRRLAGSLSADATATEYREHLERKYG
jgi:hypothetical protein